YLGQAPVKKSVPDDFESLRYTAYHEAGHALMAYAFYKHAYIYKATIEQRGNALGFVKTIHHPHITTIHKGDMEAMVGMALGGRVAEKICFNMCSTGAHNDLQYATQLAYSMIAQYGMFDDII